MTELSESRADAIRSELLNLHLALDEVRAELRALRDTSHEIRQLVGPVGVPMPDGTLLVHSIHGQVYYIDPTDTIIAPQMIVYRQWEADMSSLFRRYCNPDTVFIDVGANFGYFTCLAAGLIGNTGTGCVHAFEPAPQLARLLRRNVEINWSGAPVSIYEAAANASSGFVTLHIPQDHGANASLTQAPDIAGEQVLVPGVTLDGALPSDLVADVIKIDVEGHELSVLKGAQGIIARSPRVRLILEWSRNQMEEAGVQPASIRDFMEDFSLKPHLISLAADPLDTPLEWEWLESCDYANIVFRNTGN